MSKILRKIITIDEEKCDGCGNCVPGCVEGALQIVDGKARLVKESYCDGLGACLGECPQGALAVEELEVDGYDEAGVLGYLEQKSPDLVARHVEHLASHGIASSYSQHAPKPQVEARPHSAPIAMCPSVRMDAWAPPTLGDQSGARVGESRVKSELRQWPVQLTLLPPNAPFLHRAHLTLIADCVPFAAPNMHADFMADGAIAVGCPKLDDGQAYIKKLAQMIQASDIQSIRVAYMEVPCCRGLVFIAQQAIQLSGKDVPLTTELVAVHG